MRASSSKLDSVASREYLTINVYTLLGIGGSYYIVHLKIVVDIACGPWYLQLQ
jgi:hypothetical protein